MRALSVCVLAACGSAPHASPPPADHVEPTAVASAPNAPSVRLATSGDLDGRAGDERVTLAADGTLVAGSASVSVEIETANEVFDKQASLAVVSLGGARRGVVLTMPTSEGEDPPNRYRVFLFDHGTLRPVFDQVIGVYGVTPLVFSSTGVASYVESGWMACTRQRGAAHASIESVTLTLDAAGERLEESGRRPTGDLQACDELSACPYVDLIIDGHARRMGEILRDVRGAAAATQQPLAIGATDAGRVVIRLSEEKPEVTFLDDVFLEINGERISPLACDGGTPPAYCGPDGRSHVMRQGASLELVFEAPARGDAVVVARGYYIPTPTAATR